MCLLHLYTQQISARMRLSTLLGLAGVQSPPHHCEGLQQVPPHLQASAVQCKLWSEPTLTMFRAGRRKPWSPASSRSGSSSVKLYGIPCTK